MNPALDSRARFEAWHADWQRSTWTPLHGNDEMPAHWNTSAKRLMELAWQAAIASMAVIDPETGSMAQAYRDLIEGMSVSVDVSTGDDDAGHRYFGTITEVMDDPNDKHHVTLLVQDAAPNFNTNPVLAALAAKE